MVARPLAASAPTMFYTYKDLAEMWRVQPQTIRVWFMQLRRDGRGPRQGQCRLVQRHAAMRILLIRGDYAKFVQEVKVERVK